MPNEASKNIARRIKNGDFEKFFKGSGLDIGAGLDPIMPSVQVFDKQHGDATYMDGVTPESFDFVHSSHCLEHLKDPGVALFNWFRLVKPGGFLIVTVPDFILYEKKNWPSRFNSEHKQFFSIATLGELIRISLYDYQILRLQINDDGFDYSDKTSDQTRLGAQAEIEAVVKKVQDRFWTERPL